MPDATVQLNQLLDALSARFAAATASPAAADAIDAVLSAAPRTTAVRSLRDDPIIEAFRKELSDGLIRADTAHQLIGLLSKVVDKLPLPALPGLP